MNTVTNPDGTITFSHIREPTEKSFLTAKLISITEDCLKCLLSIVDSETSFQSSVQLISPTKRSTSTSSTGAIVMPDNSENDDKSSFRKRSLEQMWRVEKNYTDF